MNINSTRKEEVFYWPIWLSKVLNQSEQKQIKSILPKIQRAQQFLWQALNIYDDFLDGTGDPRKLPLANHCYEKFLEIHYRANFSNDYYALFNKTLNNLNKANKAEATAPRLIFKKGKLIIPSQQAINNLNISHFSPVNKSLALALGPVAIVAASGYKINSPLAEATFNFFRHVLEAKQLADDSFDWFEDLKSGLFTQATLPIIITAKKHRLEINLKRAPEIAQFLYIKYAAPEIIKSLKKYFRLARRELNLLKKRNIDSLENLLSKQERNCQEAENFRALVA